MATCSKPNEAIFRYSVFIRGYVLADKSTKKNAYIQIIGHKFADLHRKVYLLCKLIRGSGYRGRGLGNAQQRTQSQQQKHYEAFTTHWETLDVKLVEVTGDALLLPGVTNGDTEAEPTVCHFVDIG